MSPKPRKTLSALVRDILIVLCAILLVLFTAEIAARVVCPQPPESSIAAFVRSVKGPRENKPQRGGETGIRMFSIGNRLGFRDEDRATEKPRDVYRIACVGDSFMRGQGVADNDTFPAQLRRALEKKRPRLKLETMNFGMSGSDARNEAAMLLTEVPVFRPDLVVWGYVPDDIARPKEEETVAARARRFEAILRRHNLAGLRKHWRLYDYLVTRAEDAALGREMLDSFLKAYDPKANADGLRALEKDFARVGRFYRERGVRVVLFLYPAIERLDSGYPFTSVHRAAARIARDAGLEVCDTLPAFLGQKPESLWVSGNDHHPNRIGQGIAADSVAEFLTNKGLTPENTGEAKQPRRAHLTPEEKTAVLQQAEQALSGNRFDESLDALAPVLEENPGDLEAQHLTALALAGSGRPFALSPKIHRLRNAGPPWSDAARDIESNLRKEDFFR